MSQVKSTSCRRGATRRDLLCYAGMGVVAVAAMPIGLRQAHAAPQDLQALLEGRYGDRSFTDGRVALDLPEIAENGNTVPVSVTVDSPMTADDYVKSVSIFAEGNPLPEVAMFHFTPRSGIAQAATRMRLAGTQNVVAVAEMGDGTLYRAVKEVKVTIGGCGG